MWPCLRYSSQFVVFPFTIVIASVATGIAFFPRIIREGSGGLDYLRFATHDLTS